ncbi:hypothetical protein WICPIJ_002834 [Wickerhamomyces pijperi]|uniref:DASH complex subunit SPC34 n=1 Tax=Wickerhamomyces pijperi TaxID=599730 RepID=A0A9P8QAZ8_WICPI|nr:hypothetical protein WICPIJ_002834 [Wickerhamomyces pijperi]
MSELNSFIESINNTSKSIQSINFPPPGIFTNAIVSKPNIYALLRDATEQENALYYIDNQGKPERKDGKRGAVDRLNEEFENVELQNQQAASDSFNPNQDMIPDNTRPSVIPISSTESRGTFLHNGGVENLMDRFNEETQLDHEVEVLIETVRELSQRYPVRGTEEKLADYKEKWTKIKNDIKVIEKRIESQKKQEQALEDGEATLQEQEHTRYENLLQGQSPEKRSTAASAASSSSSVQEQIRETEFEIRKLKLEIEAKKRQSLWLTQENNN